MFALKRTSLGSVLDCVAPCLEESLLSLAELRLEEVWKSLTEHTKRVDVFFFTAKLYPTVKTLTSHAAQGHEILSLALQVRPNVLNHPAHPGRDVIPSGVFMPSKDGTQLKNCNS